MLPKYVAFKKDNLNLYSIFEVVPSDVEIGLPSIRLIPKLVKNLEINNMSYESNNDIIESYYVKRNTRKAPFFNLSFYYPSYTGYNFRMKYKYVNYNVPVITPPQYLGSRWSENMIEYLFAYDATDRDMRYIRNIEYANKKNDDEIINFKNNERSVITMIYTGNSAISLMQDYVIRGWLKSSINERCPITLTEFTADNICSTPCFHAISYDAAVEWISSKNNCPVCRNECRVSQLIKL